MIINQSKLNRQLAVINHWWTIAAGSGVFSACTGFGKTYVVLLIIKRMTDKFPNYRSTVIVPSKKLKEDWEKQVEEMKLPNVKVYVVNTYVKLKEGDKELQTELLACDEAHHYTNEDAQFFNKAIPITQYKYFIGASATLEAEELQFLAGCGIKFFDEITEREAEANGWIAPSIVYNLAIPFTEEDKKLSDRLNQQFRVNSAKFDHNFKLMMACSGGNKQFRVDFDGAAFWKTGKEWREWWSELRGYVEGLEDETWSPSSIYVAASRAAIAMRERKELLYNVPSKADAVLEIYDKFPDRKIVIFCETQKAADEIANKREGIKAYHAGLKTTIINGKKFGADRLRKLIIEDFEQDKCRAIVCVRALDEGFNVENIDFGIVHSYTSKKRRDVQRRGRTGRIDYLNPDKIAIIINLIMGNSHETKWLKSKQKGTRRAINIDSIDEIKLEPKTARL